MADRKVELGIDAKLNVSTTGTQALTDVQKSAADTGQAIKDLGGAGEDAIDTLAESFEKLNQAVGNLPGQIAQAMNAARFATNEQANLQRANRIINDIGPGLAGARYSSDYDRLNRRAGQAAEYLNQARENGQDTTLLDQRLKELTDRLEANRKALEDSTRASNGAGGNNGGGGGGGIGGSGGMDGLMGGPLGPVLKVAMGRAPISSLFTLAAEAIGPLGIAALVGTGLVKGFNMATNALTEGNADARNGILASADLARQYGYSGNANALFRAGNGMTANDIARYGYSATDAARVASQYDLPGGMNGDVRGILGFSRTTGIDESRTASVARTLGLAGTNERGDATKTLEILKLATTEGVAAGISRSDTIKNLVGIVEKNSQRGLSTTRTGLAFEASIQAALAQTGAPTLQGAMGAQAQNALNNASTGGGDLSMEILIGNRLGGPPTAAELHLTGAAADAYEKLRARSPLMALQMALKLAQTGRAPDFQTRSMGAIQSALQNDPILMTQYLEQSGMSAEQILEIQGRGGASKMLKTAAANRATMEVGQNIDKDNQGNNAIANRSRALGVLESDAKYLGDMAKLGLSQGLEQFLRESKAGIDIALARVALNAAGFNPWASGNFNGNVSGYQYANGAFSQGPAPTYPAQGAAGNTAPNGSNPLSLPTGGFGAELARLGDKNFMRPDMGLTSHPGQANGERGGHAGIDIPNPVGTPVYNPFPGAKVIKAGPGTTGYGNMVKLRLPTGHTVIIGHLSRIDVSVGMGTLARGALIGLSGNTGRSTGPHVHIEIRPPGHDTEAEAYRTMEEFENAWMQAASAGGTGGDPTQNPQATTGASWTGASGMDRIFAATGAGQGLSQAMSKAFGKAYNASDPIPDAYAKQGVSGLEAWKKKMLAGVSEKDRPADAKVLDEFLTGLSNFTQKQTGITVPTGATAHVQIDVTGAITVNAPGLNPQGNAAVKTAASGLSNALTNPSNWTRR